jgi:hypothetical protein
MFVNCVIHSFLCCLIFPSVNSDENSEDDYIEFTLLLHCKLETKKNARVIDFSGVFKIRRYEKGITFSFTSSISLNLLIFP